MFENPTVNLNALRNSCATIACCSSELIFTFVYASSSIQNASEQFVSSILVCFVNFAFHPIPQTNSNGVRSGDSNSSTSVTCRNLTPAFYFISQNDRYYHFPKYWLFLLNHPVYLKKILTVLWKKELGECEITLPGSEWCRVAGPCKTL